MKVQLIAMTQPIGEIPQNVPYNPSMVAERCASVCYDSKPTETYRIMESCIQSGHISTIEHISFTFHIEGVTRALLAQLSRHRHISLSVRSQRYCNEGEFDYVKPDSIVGFAEDTFSDLMERIGVIYDSLIEIDVPKEDARAILPNACCTELYMTANARALIEISHLRLCSRAQWEIRQLFIEIKKEIEKYCPEIAKYMIPSCEKQKVHFCPESKSCGRHKKLEEVLSEKDGIIEQKESEIDNLNDKILMMEDDRAFREDESSY